jgi:[ribosomal protein S18]-alanine N-acetyltransferase
MALRQGYITRLLEAADAPAVERIAVGSAWTTLHYLPGEEAHLITTRPAVGVFDPEGHLAAFALTTGLVAPRAWLGGFGVPWQERWSVAALVDLALPAWEAAVATKGVMATYYTVSSPDNDMLMDLLLPRGFRIYETIRSYDKIGADSPTAGNQEVQVRPFDPARDTAALVALDKAAFDPLWQHDAREFAEFAGEYPFFIVAEAPDGEVIGYQFSVAEGGTGFLVRVAVTPAWHSRGVGARLLHEAMRYFAGQDVLRVLLNTQLSNIHAQRLYEWFGFHAVEPSGLVLAHEFALANTSFLDP